MLKKIYPKETAGSIMTNEFPRVLASATIQEVLNFLFENFKEKKRIVETETINYIYVVDKEGKLIGVFSVKEIFGAPKETKVKQIMKKDLIKVRPDLDQEKVALLAVKNNLKSIPVVNEKNYLLGIVSSDTILSILEKEHLEDLLKAAGIHSLPRKTLEAGASFLIKVRLHWLILGFLGGVFAAKITNLFETPLKAHFILAAFIPLIVYIADAIGTQTETLLVRNLTLKETLDFKEYIIKEFKIGLVISLVLGTLLFGIGYFWSQFALLGLILGISLFLTGMAATFIPFFIINLLLKFKKDPAIASGPLATILQDIVSLAIYYTVASVMLRYLT